jgi:hypothetical protein
VLEGMAGAVIWALANGLYIDLRRKGKTGFSRIVLFWMGLPLTWLWLFLVREGSAPVLEEPPDDADAILAEIRRERRLRAGRGGSIEEGGSLPPVQGGPPRISDSPEG